MSSHFYSGLWKGVLKDDFDMSSIDFGAALSSAKGQPLQILLMGSAAKLSGPKVKTVFLEDLPKVRDEKHTHDTTYWVETHVHCYLNPIGRSGKNCRSQWFGQFGKYLLFEFRRAVP